MLYEYSKQLGEQRCVGNPIPSCRRTNQREAATAEQQEKYQTKTQVCQLIRIFIICFYQIIIVI